MTKQIKTIFLAAALLLGSRAEAFYSPLSVGVLPPVQFPPSDFSITGVRASALWGNHRDLYGIDLGVLGNITNQTFVGVGVSGLFNWTRGTTNAIGLQLAGVTNVNTNKTSVVGLQIAGITNVNTAESSVVGIQASLIANMADHTNIYGAQIGLYNTAQAVYGLQIGLVNMTKNLRGVQIGLINFHHQGLFAVAPILNVGF